MTNGDGEADFDAPTSAKDFGRRSEPIPSFWRAFGPSPLVSLGRMSIHSRRAMSGVADPCLSR